MTGSSSFWFANTGAASFYNDVVGQSLKIDDGSDARLTRTLGTATDRAKYTLSWWMKVGDTMNTGSTACIFDSGSNGANYTFIGLSSGTKLVANGVSGGSNSYALTTEEVLRDPTAWYHCMFVYDSAQSTNTDRIYFILNGTRLTSTTGTLVYPTQSADDPYWNNSNIHYIGYGGGAVGTGDFDGYLADIYHIDGQALDADDFTESKEGARIPIEYSGSYGNNGFHLNFKKEVASATGYSHYFYNSYTTFSNASHYDVGSSDDFTLEFFHKSAMTDAPNILGFYQTAGPHFMLQIGGGTSYVYMYTGNGAARTFTMGGDASYTANAWNHTAIVRSSGTMKCYINGYQTTSGTTSYSDTTAWDTDRFAIGNAYQDTSQPGFNGYISNVRLVVGSAVYTSNFTPSTTPLTNITNTKLLACQTATLTKDNSSNDVTGTTSGTISVYTDSPFTGGSPFYNDKSGTGNHFTHTNIVPNDVVLDNPENNFAVFNSLLPNGNSYSEGNLKNASGGNDWEIQVATMFPSNISGKWYAEFYVHTCDASSTRVGVGVTDANVDPEDYLGNESPDVAYYDIDDIYTGGSATADSSVTYSATDIISVLLNLDDGEVTFKKNNASMTNGTQSLVANTLYTFATSNYGSGAGVIANFGQDSSFVGEKTAQGNQDGNNIGDFFYSVPSGYLALCTANLSEPTIGPNSTNQADDFFDIVTYTGNSSTRSITFSMSPDMLWFALRSSYGGGYGKHIHDSTRGGNEYVYSSGNNTEATGTNHVTFQTNGFETGSSWAGMNLSGEPYVVWGWKANGGTTSSNSNGSITSTVQADTTAGFSIITYTGDENGGTIGHGLSQKPDFILFKSRDTADEWGVYHSYIGATNSLSLNSSSGLYGYTLFSNTEPTSSVITLGASGSVGRYRNNKSSTDYIAYCWHSVSGYSKFSGYEGIANADGVYVHLGFRPRLVAMKNLDTGGSWIVFDSERHPHNIIDIHTMWDTYAGEGTDDNIDFLSNGFKARRSSTSFNSAHTFVYMAWAEMPEKYSLAR